MTSLSQEDKWLPLSPEEKKRYFTFTSALSLCRLGFLPFILNYIRSGEQTYVIGLMAVVFALDFAARYTSRLKGETSFLGKVLDPVVDSLMISLIMGFVTWQEIQQREKFPLLLTGAVTLILLRDWILIFYSYFKIYRQTGILPRSNRLGKIASLSIFVTALFYAARLEPYDDGLLIITTTLIMASGIAYYWHYLKVRFQVKSLNLATKITSFRLLLSPMFLVAFFYDSDLVYENNHLALQILALIISVSLVVTDGLDGYFARKRNEVTKIGKYLDPFSDKISNLTIFLCFLGVGYAPVWMVALVYYREATIETLRTLAASENMVMAARYSGKFKTAMQGTGIITILTLAVILKILEVSGFPSAFPVAHIIILNIWNYIPYMLMAMVTAITVYSGVDYILAARPVLKKYF